MSRPVSIDGAGYRGPVLRELTDPDGLNLEVFTPPTERMPLTVFAPRTSRSARTARRSLAPPAKRRRSTNAPQRHRCEVSLFQEAVRRLRDAEQCLADPTTKSRTVIKNDYEVRVRPPKREANAGVRPSA